ncbi:MAG: AsmA family protein [Kiritimatiellae bacterium]|nr:AsmA family protein [Kiritimatiellia bacterium]
MKRLLKAVIGVVVILVVLLVALSIFAGHIIKGAVNAAGPKALGVPISLKNVEVNMLSGHFGLDELVIGNPEGFNTPEAIRVNHVAVDVKMSSLFSRVLVIDRIYVRRPEITYEVGLKGSNIGTIQNKAAPSTPAAEQPEQAEKPAKEAKAGKKVQINDFLIESGNINVSTIGMAGHSAPIPLPTIHLTDIGKESDGATPQEVIVQIFSAIGGTVSSTATGIGKGIMPLGKGAVDTGKAAAESAVDVGKAAGEGAVDAGKAVGEGAVGAGKAVGEGASKALESVGGLLK